MQIFSKTDIRYIMPNVPIKHLLEFGPSLPDKIHQIACDQGECDMTTSNSIAEFRNYIKERNECQPIRTDDEFLLKFLRARFWKIPACYKLLCNYCKFRDQNKDFYEDVRPLDLKIIGDADILSVTPYRDQDDHRILIYRFGVWKPSSVSVDDIFRASIVLLELGSLEPIAQIVGGVGIFDLKDLSVNHLLHLSPSVAQKMIALLVTSMPIRTTAIHIVNQNWIFNTAFNIFKPFMNTSMRQKLFIHGTDMKSLHKHISPDHLPKRYGGVHDDYPYTLWFDNLVGNSKLQKDLESLGYIFD